MRARGNSRARRMQRRADERHIRKVRLALEEKARRDRRHQEKLSEGKARAD